MEIHIIVFNEHILLLSFCQYRCIVRYYDMYITIILLYIYVCVCMCAALMNSVFDVKAHNYCGTKHISHDILYI